jgi:ABC-type lipoprotein release transport system permease subunit
MRLSITSKFALRNLTRNTRRSLLSISGVAIGCAIALINIGMVKGKIDLFVKNMAEAGTGHLRVVPEKWPIGHDNKLRLKDGPRELAELRALPEVKVATPRSRIQGLLAMGTRVSGVELVGVDPETEPKAFRYVRAMTSGRYLKPGDSHVLVIGKALAEKLRVDIGDPLVVTVVDDKGSMKSEMFDVIGIASVGVKQLELALAQIMMNDASELSGLSDFGEITVLLKDPEDLDALLQKIRRSLAKTDTVLGWPELSPQSQMAIAINIGVTKFMTAILIFVSLLGVASAQLTAVLERRKEFAVLSAVGMNGKKILRLLFSEALALGTVSLIATIIIGGPITYYISKVGIRILDPNQNMAAMGTIIDPIFYGNFGVWFFGYACFLCYVSTIAASIYPSIFALRLHPAEALRVAQ